MPILYWFLLFFVVVVGRWSVVEVANSDYCKQWESGRARMFTYEAKQIHDCFSEELS
jgi:hypothetical protein